MQRIEIMMILILKLNIKINDNNCRDYKYFMNEIRNKIYGINLDFCFYIKMSELLCAIDTDKNCTYHSMRQCLEVINKFII